MKLKLQIILNTDGDCYTIYPNGKKTIYGDYIIFDKLEMNEILRKDIKKSIKKIKKLKFEVSDKHFSINENGDKKLTKIYIPKVMEKLQKKLIKKLKSIRKEIKVNGITSELKFSDIIEGGNQYFQIKTNVREL